MKINAQKTHEIIISFAKDKPNPPTIEIDGENIDRVNGAKLVGLCERNQEKKRRKNCIFNSDETLRSPPKSSRAFLQIG